MFSSVDVFTVFYNYANVC